MFGGIWDSVVGAVDSVVSSVTDTVTNIVDSIGGVADSVTNTSDKVTDAVGGVGNTQTEIDKAKEKNKALFFTGSAALIGILGLYFIMKKRK